jgi:hypothetical protein
VPDAKILTVHINASVRWDSNMSRVRAARTLTNVKLKIFGQLVAMAIALILLVVMHVNVNRDMFIKEWVLA